MYREINIDCLSGPTHHFGGLSYGNIASIKSQGTLSHPKLAALQGLEKMKLLLDLGIPQIVLPPYLRPDIQALRDLGFSGTEQELVATTYRTNLELLLQVSSSSAMWMANAATCTPSSDTLDGKLHITPANLASNYHRTLEVPTTTELLQTLLHDKRYFVEHPPLQPCTQLLDEGAANHTRFSNGLHLFVHAPLQGVKKYPSRQTKAAQLAIVRRHQLSEKKVIFAEQTPEAIDAGCFHNDVISTGFETLFLYHEKAFVDSDAVIRELKGIECIKISNRMLTLQKAVSSYFFNSQIVRSNGKIILIAPRECLKLDFIKKLTCFDEVIYVDLHESMKNGGGPACLRLRLPLNDRELAAIPQTVFLTEKLYKKLKKIIETSYPDTFHPKDLLNPDFRKECKSAIHALHRALL